MFGIENSQTDSEYTRKFDIDGDNGVEDRSLAWPFFLSFFPFSRLEVDEKFPTLHIFSFNSLDHANDVPIIRFLWLHS